MEKFSKITGSAKVRPDDAGRILIPGRFREALSLFDELILTLHPHGCLTLYPDKRFRELEEKMASMSNIGYFESHLQEVLIGCAEPLSFDGSGRFKVSPHLRQRANLRREALLFGVGDCIRIWDEERWEQRNLLMTARLQDDGISETWRQLNI